MSDNLKEMVRYWERTKDISMAWDICQLLLDELNSEEE